MPGVGEPPLEDPKSVRSGQKGWGAIDCIQCLDEASKERKEE